MLSFGVCAAKDRPVRGYIRYAFPSYLMKMSRSKGNRNIQTSICSKLGGATHQSSVQARHVLLPYFIRLFQRDRGFQVRTSIELRFDEEEIAFLLGEKIDSSAVKHVVSEMKRALDGKDQLTERRIEKQSPEVARKAEKLEARAQPASSQKTLF